MYKAHSAKLRCGIPVCGLLLVSAATVRAGEWTKRWPVGAKPELHVTAGDAGITVETGSGNEISAVLRTRGIEIGPSGIKVVEHQTGDRVELEIREPSMHFGWGMRSIELTLRVPRDLIADFHTGDGSIKMRGLHGSVRANTGDGSIDAQDLDGNLDMHSGDGSVHVKGRFETLQLRTSDGSIDAEILSGSHMRSDWRVETGDGSIRLQVPHDLAADVELQTGDGSIHTDLTLTVQGSRNEHSIRGKLNGGGPVLEIRTGDGSISLSGS